MKGYELSRDHEQRYFVATSVIAQRSLLLVREARQTGSANDGWLPATRQIDPAVNDLERVARRTLKWDAGVKHLWFFGRLIHRLAEDPIACEPQNDGTQEVFIPGVFFLDEGMGQLPLRHPKSGLEAAYIGLDPDSCAVTGKKGCEPEKLYEGLQTTPEVALHAIVHWAFDEAAVIDDVRSDRILS